MQLLTLLALAAQAIEHYLDPYDHEPWRWRFEHIGLEIEVTRREVSGPAWSWSVQVPTTLTQSVDGSPLLLPAWRFAR